jgi:hypothetical protein
LEGKVLTGPNVILALKIAVIAVSLIFAASLVCLLMGRYRWHGRLNIVFFTLTLAAVIGLEAIVRFIDPTIFDYFNEEERRRMAVHLSFSIPAAVLLPIMLVTGLTRRRRLHMVTGTGFAACWIGTLYTGVFLLPH